MNYFQIYKIKDFEEKQYNELFSSTFWDYNFVKHNFPISISGYKPLFKAKDDYFNIFPNDYREPINIKEFYLFLSLKANNPNTLFHSLFNYLPLSRYRNSAELIKALNNLEIRGYIRIDRNYKVEELYCMYNARKQHIVKIVAVDVSGKPLTITFSEKKRQEKIKKIRKKFDVRKHKKSNKKES